MQIQQLHTSAKPISSAPLFKATEGQVITLRILANEQLKEHTTKVPALLICVSGESVFENELGYKLALQVGEYVLIEPHVKHWINAQSTSCFVLIK
ncbi:MAG: hypothetical protein IPH78_02005 [Bacteroidetes bacterium]|nr:hypothetical protein [Bacteroidota bacterium]MBK8658207.1 hypothetical protein [Bacteroidota bacterium]